MEREQGVLNGIMNWLENYVKDYEGQKEKILQYVTKCKEARDLREAVDDLYDLVSNLDQIKTLSEQVHNRLKEYWNTLSSTNNIGRYQQGRLIIPAATIIVPFGIGVASKAERLKDALKLLKEASADKWKKFIDELGGLASKRTVIRGADEIIDLVKAEQRYAKTYASSTNKPYGLQMSLEEVERVFGPNGKKIVLETEKKAQEIISQTGGNIPGDPVLTGLVDNKTGKVFYGRNLKTKREIDNFMADLHPVLKKRLDYHNSQVSKGLNVSASDIQRAGDTRLSF